MWCNCFTEGFKKVPQYDFMEKSGKLYVYPNYCIDHTVLKHKIYLSVPVNNYPLNTLLFNIFYDSVQDKNWYTLHPLLIFMMKL